MSRAKWQSWLVLALLAFTARAGGLEFRELPKPVQRTINRHLDGGAVQSISHVVQGSQPLFAITIRQGMGPLKIIHVTIDGLLIEPGWTGRAAALAIFD